MVAPPFVPPGEQDAALAELGFSILSAGGAAELLSEPAAALSRWLPFWDDLPPGTRTLEARLDQSDALALDNAAWSVVGADRPTRVLLVSDGNVFVERALGLLRTEIERDMKLMGVTSIDQLSRGNLRFRPG